jgi:hypothetical protein
VTARDRKDQISQVSIKGMGDMIERWIEALE